jgi:transposase
VTAGASFGFADEMRLGLRGMVRRVWGRRGVKVRRRLQLSYRWRYLFMIVDGRAGRIYWCWHERMAATELLGMVRAVQQQTDLAALVWDGAPSHREERVQALGLPLIGLPPYSPELNPAERFFQEVRRAVEGEPYATLDAKVAAVQDVLEQWDADPHRVRSLCGWQWIEDAAHTLPSARDIAA